MTDPTLRPGMKACLTCATHIAVNAPACPKCGAPQPVQQNPILALVGLGFMGFAAFYWYSCYSAVTKSTTITASTPTVATPARDCCMGEAEKEIEWGFNGLYEDALCTKPVVEGHVGLCSPVFVRPKVKVSFTDPLPGFQQYETQEVELIRTVDFTNAPVFIKREGVCKRMKESVGKIAPIACLNERICRTTSGVMGCGEACGELPSGCPNYQGSVTHASFKTGKAR